MLNAIIRFSLNHRLIVLAVAVILTGFGAMLAARRPIDVFPDLNRPRVVVMTEAPGMAPEEVETLITFPIETALNGATGVDAVRSSSSVGISVVYAEFDWSTEIYTDRQIVAERLQVIQDRLPPGVRPQLAPVSSIMGQVLMLGLWSEDGAVSPMRLRTVADWDVRQRLLTVPGVSQVYAIGGERMQFQVLVRPEALLQYGVTLEQVEQAVVESNENATGGYLDRQGPSELLVRALGRIRSLEDLRAVVVGHRDGRSITLADLADVRHGAQVKRGDASAFVRVEERGPGAGSGEQGGTGDTSGPPPLAPEGRGAGGEGRVRSATNPPETAPRPALGHLLPSGEKGNDDELSEDPEAVTPPPPGWSGGPAVILTINKQPGADTRQVSELVMRAIEDLRPTLPAGVTVAPLYAQEAFIDRAIENVVAALRDGAFLVVVILLVFLMNLRTTFITLTAIPLSLVMTAIVFTLLDVSINTMTLGGLAVAMGELVDDAIVDVENIHRRLQQNARADRPLPSLLVVFRASAEVRNSIVFGTMVVIIVFLPLLALDGMEGRLFAPLALAYIVSILASLAVSLTVTPALASVLLGSTRAGTVEHDGLVLRALKVVAERAIRFSLAFPALNLSVMVGLALVAGVFLSRLEQDFLPPFNEGTVQLNVVLPPGTSLATSNQINRTVEAALTGIDDIDRFSRRTGRAELDEHAEGVNVSEYFLDFDPASPRSREEQLAEVRSAMAEIPGVAADVEQPLAHLMSHMISGVKAHVGIKIYGDDLDTLRQSAERMKAALVGVPGVTDLRVEPLVLIPQLRIELDRDQLRLYGLSAAAVGDFIRTAMNGDVVSDVLIGQRTFDLVVRLEERSREDVEALGRLSLETPGGGRIPLSAVATIYESAGPNTISREDVRRRIVIQCNVEESRGIVDVVADIRRAARPVVAGLPGGYYVEYAGQFENQASARRTIVWLFLLSLVGVFLVLTTMFGSVNLALQVMIALVLAFIGSVAALVLTGQTLTIAAIVGFISLAGIATRNGILLVNHYLHLVRYEHEAIDKPMIVRAGLERLAPVLMTALTAGIGLVPLVLAAGQPGKEILYPVATVILGGLISSTLLDFLVHPALFWLLGRGATARVIARDRRRPALTEEAVPVDATPLDDASTPAPPAPALPSQSPASSV